jgi:hypothetical protein
MTKQSEIISEQEVIKGIKVTLNGLINIIKQIKKNMSSDDKEKRANGIYIAEVLLESVNQFKIKIIKREIEIDKEINNE